MNVPRLLAGPAILAACLAAACHESDTAGIDPANAFIRGSVTVQKTGEGVPNMVVVLMRGGDAVATALTDPLGRFGFDTQKPGSYTARLIGLELTPFRPDFAALEPESRDIVVGRDPIELVFTIIGLLPPRVSGSVACGGQPVDGALVRVVGGSADTTVATNSLGRYGANDLGTGFHSVFLVNAPCTPGRPWEIVDLRPGQAAEVNFGG